MEELSVKLLEPAMRHQGRARCCNAASNMIYPYCPVGLGLRNAGIKRWKTGFSDAEQDLVAAARAKSQE
jgi:hypothetical protein